MKIYKKVIMIFLLCLTAGTILFFTDRNVMITYAYTEEEKAAAKAWLSQNGYSPTMDGAQQAYQDYLNGKFGSVDSSEIPEGSVPQTPDETNTETGKTTSPVSQKGDSVTGTKTEEKESSSDSGTKTEEKESSSDSETKTEEKEGGSDSETKAEKKEGSTDSETKEVTQTNGTGSETNGTEQKGTSENNTKNEEIEGSSDSKTKADSQKEKSDVEAKAGKSDHETKIVEKKQTGNTSTEDSIINSEITAGNSNTAKHGKINVIMIIVVIGAIVLIYFIRHFYIRNRREKIQQQ